MNIKTIYILLLTIFISTKSENQKTILEFCLEQHKKAFLDLKKVIDQVRITTSTRFIGNRMITETNYLFESRAAYDAFKAYDFAVNTFDNELLSSALTKGLLLGCFGNLLDFIRILIQKEEKLCIPITIINYPLCAAAIAHIILSNRQMQPEPYFLFNHIEKKNYFSNTNLPTFIRILCSLFATNVGFFGLRFIIGTLIENSDPRAKYFN